jgi:LmbE family N-acetylglucosaminyl deacetylase
MNLFLSPHNDDETLFGSFTILRHAPHVVVCLRSDVQEKRGGPPASRRESETDRALFWLRAPSWEQLLTLDTDPDYGPKLVDDFERLDKTHRPEKVWTPAIENEGHEQHNGVTLAAMIVFGERLQPYMTYQRGNLGSRGVEVPFESSWIESKLRAMSCYGSQHEIENTRPWFLDATLREYVPLGEIERVGEDDGA